MKRRGGKTRHSCIPSQELEAVVKVRLSLVDERMQISKDITREIMLLERYFGQPRQEGYTYIRAASAPAISNF
jgi:hypothetical protein